MIEVTNIISKELLDEYKKIGIQHLFMPYIKKIKIRDVITHKIYKDFHHTLFYCNGVPFDFRSSENGVYKNMYCATLSEKMKLVIENSSNVSEIYEYVARVMIDIYYNGKHDKKSYFQNINTKEKKCDLKKIEDRVVIEYSKLESNIYTILEKLDLFGIEYEVEDILFDLKKENLIDNIDFLLTCTYDEIINNRNKFPSIEGAIIKTKYQKEVDNMTIVNTIEATININSYRNGRICIGSSFVNDKKVYAEYKNKQLIINYENFENKIEKELLELIERDKHLFYQLRDLGTLNSVEGLYRKTIFDNLKTELTWQVQENRYNNSYDFQINKNFIKIW